MNLAAALEYPDSKKVVLLILSGAEPLIGWSDNGDGTWDVDLLYPGSMYRVTGVSSDGSMLLEGEWSWDKAAGTITIDEDEIGSPADPREHVMLAHVELLMGNWAKSWGLDAYEARIAEAPKISLRVEEFFGGVGQIGSASIELLNGDRFFESMPEIIWHEAVLDFGVDR